MKSRNENFSDLVIYQIYPRSFKDSNNDGIGDIQGIIEKLDYLCDLGINAVWLCPCYKSPNYDHGYDISDYRDIMDEFGSFDDIKSLISEMNKRGMKLIMDLVPNHTSSEHKWFVESRKSKNNPYSDYYYWFDEPINDWQACFGGSAWEYDDVRKQYYLHSYAIQQPDLNWENPKVVKEIQDVVDFWIDQGVSGFRCDVIDQISKDFEGNQNCFGPNLHKYINALFGREKTKDIFTVGECWTSDINEIKRHTDKSRGELSTLFQFDHQNCGREDKWTPKADSLKSLRDILIKWQTLTQDNDLLYSIFSDNHDQNLLISRIGNDRELRYESATCIAAMLYLLKGVPFIYQGQEFGVTAAEYNDISAFDDIESINMFNELIENGCTKEEAMKKINFGSRDNPRRPMAWNNSVNFGFSQAKPWIALHNRAEEINLENDLKSDKSIHAFYKKLLSIRKNNAAFRKGEFKAISSPKDNYFIYQRNFESESFTVICNFEQPSNIDGRYLSGEKILSNYTDEATAFRPYEIAVYRVGK